MTRLIVKQTAKNLICNVLSGKRHLISQERFMKTVSWIRRWVLMIATALCVAPLSANAATDNGTLTVGSESFGDCGSGNFQHLTARGYLGAGGGSYSPTTLTGGKTISDLYDVSAIACSSSAHIYVSGFSSNPGSSWLTSVTCNSVTLSSPAATFDYSGGVAGWHWFSTKFGFLSGVYSCSIVHS
jgi:hypothetical protein